MIDVCDEPWLLFLVAGVSECSSSRVNLGQTSILVSSRNTNCRLKYEAENRDYQVHVSETRPLTCHQESQCLNCDSASALSRILSQTESAYYVPFCNQDIGVTERYSLDINEIIISITSSGTAVFQHKHKHICLIYLHGPDD